uniref:Uncharacterized protein n=1 Tax=Gibberella zeae TaxID=5518 RepID=A0A4E9EPG1_GIBZA
MNSTDHISLQRLGTLCIRQDLAALFCFVLLSPSKRVKLLLLICFSLCFGLNMSSGATASNNTIHCSSDMIFVSAVPRINLYDPIGSFVRLIIRSSVSAR